MNHFGHMLVGLAVAGAAMYALHVYSLQLISIALLAAILPDIDLAHSKASKITHFVAFIGGAFILRSFFSSYGDLASWIIGGVASFAALLVLLFPLRLKHRGVTHSFKAAALFGIVTGIALGINAGIIALLAYASHLAVDKL